MERERAVFLEAEYGSILSEGTPPGGGWLISRTIVSDEANAETRNTPTASWL